MHQPKLRSGFRSKKLQQVVHQTQVVHRGQEGFQNQVDRLLEHHSNHRLQEVAAVLPLPSVSQSSRKCLRSVPAPPPSEPLQHRQRRNCFASSSSGGCGFACHHHTAAMTAPSFACSCCDSACLDRACLGPDCGYPGVCHVCHHIWTLCLYHDRSRVYHACPDRSHACRGHNHAYRGRSHVCLGRRRVGPNHYPFSSLIPSRHCHLISNWMHPIFPVDLLYPRRFQSSPPAPAPCHTAYQHHRDASLMNASTCSLHLGALQTIESMLPDIAGQVYTSPQGFQHPCRQQQSHPWTSLLATL
mmetsp:Transcript_119498/g.223387  ORF Transcript_119498/g.223387 Transcript_119498/m.223387 type:complete len:300 (-) Transcript_119498:1045-1944(-)